MYIPPFGPVPLKPFVLNRTAGKWLEYVPLPALVALEVCLAIAGCGGGTASTPGGNQVSTIPTPTISTPTISTISPASNVAGSPAFTLTVSGLNFLSTSVVSFGGNPVATTFVSSTQLTAAITAAAIASAGTATVTVTSPASGGGTSNAVNFTINAVSLGPFTRTGSMATARAGHTATLLPNGKVLIAGGAQDRSAELYDPSTRKFAPTGNMNAARTRHTATLLANGKVLISGGLDSSGSFSVQPPLASAELYDPSSGMFTPTGSMTTPQGWSPATLLADGRVLVAKGDHAEIYDPATGTFALTGAYADPTPAFWMTATLLLDGRVLLTGGAGAGQSYAKAAELFDPLSATFSITGPLHGDRVEYENTATLLTNGTVLVVESTDDPGPEDVVEVYDPATGTFTVVAQNLSSEHAFSAAVRLTNGTVLITGGQLPGGNGQADAELYLPATRTFTSAGNMTTNMTTGRHSHTATLLPDITVLIVGGYTTWPTPTASAEIYDPSCQGCWDY